MYKVINENGREFLKIEDGNINILFSTAKNDISYKLSKREGISNLNELKNIFNVSKVNYTNQIHGNKIINLDNKDSKEEEADGLLISKKNEIAGIFTADCVPVIIYDKDKEVISAIHSGWKGTINDISKKACLEMKEKYNCENIKIIIGPCVSKCCYEVSEDLAKKFTEKYGDDVVSGRMLDLKKVIKIQVSDLVKKENILDLDLCTVCNKELKLHSYRNLAENSGRLFSFAYIK